MEPVSKQPKNISQQEYQDARKKLDEVMGKLHASTGDRTAQKLSPAETKELQDQKNYCLDILARGPMLKYGPNFLKRFTEVSLANREVINYLSDQAFRLEDFYEKMLKLDKDSASMIVDDCSDMGLGVSLESINLNTLTDLLDVIQEYDENNQEIQMVQSVFDQSSKELSTLSEKIKNKRTKLEKLMKVMRVYESSILDADKELKKIMDEYSAFGISIPMESININDEEGLPKEVLILKKKYDKIQSKKKIIEGHIKRNKSSYSLLNSELKIMEGIRNALLERADVLEKHFEKRIDEYRNNIDAVKEQYNALNLSVPITSWDLAKCNKLIDLKMQYNQSLENQKRIGIKIKEAQQKSITLKEEIAYSKYALRQQDKEVKKK